MKKEKKMNKKNLGYWLLLILLFLTINTNYQPTKAYAQAKTLREELLEILQQSESLTEKTIQIMSPAMKDWNWSQVITLSQSFLQESLAIETKALNLHLKVDSEPTLWLLRAQRAQTNYYFLVRSSAQRYIKGDLEKGTDMLELANKELELLSLNLKLAQATVYQLNLRQ